MFNKRKIEQGKKTDFRTQFKKEKTRKSAKKICRHKHKTHLV